MRTIRVDVPPASLRARYSLGVLLALLGLTPVDAADADVSYGGRASHGLPSTPEPEWGRIPEVTRVDGVAVLHPPGAPPARLPDADLLYAAYAALTAPWEADDPADEVGTPLARDGFLDRNGLLGEALVHRYAAVLGERLRETPRRSFALVVTHDVDDNFARIFARRESRERLRRELRARRATAVRRAAGLARRLVRPPGDENDRFDDWRAWHRARGSRPAYFAASFGLFDANGHRHDVAYDVRHPDVRRVLAGAAADGAEIGVHFSIEAREGADRLRAERERLEEIIDAPVRSARHHWWALGDATSTWAAQAEAGIALDCSLGFNDAIGFRRGICVPFRPFDETTGAALPLHVVPTLAMDAAAGLDELRALGRTVRDVGGALVLDWHVHAANPRALPGALEGLTAFVDETLAQGAVPRTPLELLEAA